ncbi:hydrogenase large subunit domain protein [Thermosinus carboxydivorans Nor1]|uniref:Hydrogenase large subunit domain protein n=1 Tax=Thermosinus carboxydivorans Nor1 TaxID=401526 RepID=A1HT68_9FIRM|nr:[Fe-Fe] hydrogenase large subunit C-terminal domain-containing protein [Thermosinus carboxydivorans]EAX46747.1 hydrogenase large subunit domain protein [Thermosinus carboxydivorans Nor1]
MKVLTTLQANCKDCHRCVRVCPIKAIGIRRGQARLVDDKCILCGKCVVECPQQAKQVISQIPVIQDALAQGRLVVMSLAPSFVGAFPAFSPEQFFAAVRSLGFTVIEETAVGAEVVSQIYSSLITTADKPVISACCPVVVRLVERYYPELVGNLAPVVSPMQAHGRILKKRYGNNAFVVFAGPCIAKFAELAEANSAIDAVITFQQLNTWLKQQANHNTPCRFQTNMASSGRYFPIAGGILKTCGHTSAVDAEIVAVDGIENCIQVFDGIIKGQFAPKFVEALACTGGCINGPAMVSGLCLPARRAKVISFAVQGGQKPLTTPPDLDFKKVHQAKPVQLGQPSEQEIREILSQIGKLTPADEKNCGACGYNSCREKAIAVYQGMAEIDMCVPYMRSRAESFANMIVDNSLNAIIVVNDKLIIQEFNPAAEQMLQKRQDWVRGASLTEIMDCAEIIRAINSGVKVPRHRVELPLYGLITEQMIIPLPDEGLAILIISDITEQEKRAKELEQVKLETVEKATDIINKQMQVAQEIAGLLGETTAETKSALLELIWLLKGKGAK